MRNRKKLMKMAGALALSLLTFAAGVTALEAASAASDAAGNAAQEAASAALRELRPRRLSLPQMPRFQALKMWNPQRATRSSSISRVRASSTASA